MKYEVFTNSIEKTYALVSNKLLILSTAALLISGLSFAHEKEKGKDKDKKAKTTCTKGCPGKECGKKKG